MDSLCHTCATHREHCSGNCSVTLKRILAASEKARDASQTAGGGPRTPAGKAVSARNATTHGLFARDIVLPSLGEDPEGYRQLADEFTAQLHPRSLLERHYVEKIAAASWRLRRLHRWQAQLFEDETLTEDERLDRLDKVLRHETALHRQIDTAVKMLNKDVPQLGKSRARDQALWDTQQTEGDCRENRENALEVEFETRERLKQTEAGTAAVLEDTARQDAAENCQNEPMAGDLSPRAASARVGAGQNCQNEPPAPSASPIIGGRGVPSDSGTSPLPPASGGEGAKVLLG